MIKIFIFCVFLAGALATPCSLKAFKTGLVCVCNKTYCDTLEFKLPKNKGEVLMLSTSRTGLRFKENRLKFGEDKVTVPEGPYFYHSTSSNPNLELIKEVLKIPDRFENPHDNVVNVNINRTATYQKIIGFGGAFTGAVSHNLKQLESPDLRRHVYESYYSTQIGNGYNLMRFPIGGCDFDLEPWAYNEEPEHDPYLSNFNEIDKRDVEKIEQINVLKKITRNFDIKMIGAAWSPPRWMKTNNEWSGFSALRDEYYETWANYHVKYLELMNERNFSFWAISTGNEPLNGVILSQVVHFMSLGWLPRQQGQWVAQHLGPAIRKSSTAFGVKILASDDQRYTLPYWIDQMYEADPDVAQFIDGIAVHWYADQYFNPSNYDTTVGKFPGKFIISTEASSGDRPWNVHKPILGFWPRAEDYVIDIIEDLNHHVSGWVDWNLILDLKGGPNYAKNFVDSPILFNTEGTEIYKQPVFYMLGHFSRFLIPDSVRMRAKSSHLFIKTTVFLRPDGYTVVILYNIANHRIDVNVFDKEHGVLRVRVPAKSVHTLVYK